jgi:hypothetical protein
VPWSAFDRIFWKNGPCGEIFPDHRIVVRIKSQQRSIAMDIEMTASSPSARMAKNFSKLAGVDASGDDRPQELAARPGYLAGSTVVQTPANGCVPARSATGDRGSDLKALK